MGLILSFVFLTAVSQTITVRSDEGKDVDYEKFKTFYWASQVDNEADEGQLFLNDLVLKAQLRDAIKSEMLGLGYEINADNPDLVINFRVFDKAVKIHHNEGYGDYWGTTAMRDISEETTYDLEPGTLIVSLADRESGAIVWHGFASGLIDNNQFIKDEGKIKEAVNLIFGEYTSRAKEYTKK